MFWTTVESRGANLEKFAFPAAAGELKNDSESISVEDMEVDRITPGHKISDDVLKVGLRGTVPNAACHVPVVVQVIVWCAVEMFQEMRKRGGMTELVKRVAGIWNDHQKYTSGSQNTQPVTETQEGVPHVLQHMRSDNEVQRPVGYRRKGFGIAEEMGCDNFIFPEFRVFAPGISDRQPIHVPHLYAGTHWNRLMEGTEFEAVTPEVPSRNPCPHDGLSIPHSVRTSGRRWSDKAAMKLGD